MNVMLMSLLYPRENMDEVTQNSKDGLQNQINSYQHAFIRGIDENLGANERLDILNSLPVGVFPSRYRKLFLPRGVFDGRIRELGGINLPWFKQKGREIRAARALRAWTKADEANRTVLLYTLYLPYMKAVAKVKKRCKGLRAAVIVTDLPNEWGLASWRQGLLKRIEYAMGDRRLKRCDVFDGFVLLTEPMGEVLPMEGKPHIVIEGLILERGQELQTKEAGERPTVLYTGTLNRELGIAELLEAFETLPEYDLWLCGRGDMEAEAAAHAKRYQNICYFGFLPQEKALELQARATLLINPRSPKGIFTRYSFPSKTMEYMRSGKPVLCCRLMGIPAEYDDYLYYISQEGAEGIRRAVKSTLALGADALCKRGLAGRAFVLEKKNPRVQCERLVRFLRALV